MDEELFELNSGELAELPNTPEEEAFRLAESILPMKANTLRKPPDIIQVKIMEFTRKKLVELAHYINIDLSTENIARAGADFGCDYNDYYGDDDDRYWFNADGMALFLEWCKPREKGLFD